MNTIGTCYMIILKHQIQVFQMPALDEKNIVKYCNLVKSCKMLESKNMDAGRISKERGEIQSILARDAKA